MKSTIRYGSIIFHNNTFYLFLNEGSTHFTCFTRMYKLDNNFKIDQKQIIFREPGHISHNLNIFKSRNRKDFMLLVVKIETKSHGMII